MSLKPARYNFTIYQSATFYKQITWEVGGEPQPLQGYGARLVIKEDIGDTSSLLTLDTGSNGGIVLGGSAGTIALTITDTVTSNITWDVGQYELFVIDPSLRTDVLLRGAFKVIPF